MDTPSAEELLAATAVLKRLSPSDLATETPELAALCEAGKALFQRIVLQERFGEADAVAFLREQAGNRALLRKLEKLQKSIDKEHELMYSASKQAAILDSQKR